MHSIPPHVNGDEYVTHVRALAIMADMDDQAIRCSGCANNATYVGMQRCGTPGGPVCTDCLALHQAFVEASSMIADAQPWCRHCDSDVDRSHVYAVNLADGTEVTF